MPGLESQLAAGNDAFPTREVLLNDEVLLMLAHAGKQRTAPQRGIVSLHRIARGSAPGLQIRNWLKPAF